MMNAQLTTTCPILEMNSEEIRYAGFTALTDVTLKISKNEKIALLGQSGAGKTTLLKRLYQLKPNSSSFIHQQYALVPQLTVFHNIYMGKLDSFSILHNLINLIRPTTARVDEILPIAADLGLKEKLFTKVGELSGGQQQRVGIGRALYQGGEILFADEPVSSLDMVQSEEIISMITRSKKTIISSMHSIDFSLHFFDRIIGLRNQGIFFDLPSSDVSERILADLYA
jgi:phosphonate transport system ATP-binding protein